MILKPGTGKRTINGRDFKDYFHSEVQNMIANLPFAILGNAEEWDVEVTARGGGIAGQMGAVRLGISRALVANDAEVKPALKKEGLMTRDARAVERKKFGRKKARSMPGFFFFCGLLQGPAGRGFVDYLSTEIAVFRGILTLLLGTFGVVYRSVSWMSKKSRIF